MRIIRASLLICLIGVIAGGCSSTPSQQPRFAEVDADGNGYVNWPEYRKAFPDTNKNAFLTTDEDSDERLDISEFRAGIGVSF